MQQVQVACDSCGAELVPNAAYCERCGTRTRRARRLVRLAIRVELLFFLLVVGLVIAFTWISSVQRGSRDPAIRAQMVVVNDPRRLQTVRTIWSGAPAARAAR